MKRHPQNIVGPRIANARKKSKPRMTQQDLSDRLGRLGAKVDRAGIAKIETGQRRVFDFELVALAKVLEVSTNWLLSGKKK